MALDEFLRAAKAQGASDDFLVALLRERGWPAGEIFRALGRHYEEATGIAIPEPRSGLESAREAFFHLLAFSTLGTWVIATGNLWFELIDRWFPDPTSGPYGAYAWTWSRVAWQMASLIVAFPAFVWVTSRIVRDQEASAEPSSSEVRRWLTNIALLVTAVVLIGDLVTFVATFLEGGITGRFLAKCITVSVLASAVFLYYNRGLARDRLAPSYWHRAFALVALAVIAVTLGLGFLATGSPATRRMVNEDRRRVQDLHRLAADVSAQSRRAFPAEPQSTAAKDPFLDKPYEFRPLEHPRFELCADFAAASPVPPSGVYDRWQHPAGRHCFAFDVNQPAPYPFAY